MLILKLMVLGISLGFSVIALGNSLSCLRIWK